VRVPELVLVAPPELEGVAAQIARVDASRLSGVMRLIGATYSSAAIRVVLATETSDVGRETPRWIAGFADSRTDTIVLFPARAPHYPYDSLDELLQHEVAHILIARAAPGADIPRWFHEGLAMAAERVWRLEDHRRLAMLALGSHPPLSALDAEFNAGADRAARAYSFAGAFMRDLLTRYGAGFPAGVLARLATGQSFDLAFRDTTGASLEEAERIFWRYRWWSQVLPFVTSTAAIWMGIVVLALYAMRRRARYRAAIRRRWEDEERTAESGSAADSEPAADP
jgi:hypothetical protein